MDTLFTKFMIYSVMNPVLALNEVINALILDICFLYLSIGPVRVWFKGC